jgi:hypothetical protein
VDRSLDDLELELRKVPGVMGVAFEEDAGVVRVQLTVSSSAPSRMLLRSAEDAVRNIDSDRVILSVIPAGRGDGTGMPGGRERRVQLVAVRRWGGPAGDGVEVHLRVESRQVVGRDLIAGPGGAAAATLDGLEKLGFDIPFQITATVPSAPAPDGVTVLVKVGSVAGLSGRMGLVKAATADEAASRAVLSALNRYLSDPRNSLSRPEGRISAPQPASRQAVTAEA